MGETCRRFTIRVSLYLNNGAVVGIYGDILLYKMWIILNLHHIHTTCTFKIMHNEKMNFKTIRYWYLQTEVVGGKWLLLYRMCLGQEYDHCLHSVAEVKNA
jgi:hypothetical protein